MNNVEKFKEYSAWKPIACSVNLKLPLFNEWLDEIKEAQRPHTKFALFFQAELTDERIEKFVSALRAKYPTQDVEIHKGVTAEEMTEIIAFCDEFNGTTDPPIYYQCADDGSFYSSHGHNSYRDDGSVQRQSLLDDPDNEGATLVLYDVADIAAYNTMQIVDGEAIPKQERE